MSSASIYSSLDRFLYHVAFFGIGVQKALADIEDRMFASDLYNTSLNNPIFITSLPRAGTTLLLEVLYEVPGLATHTYRDMPFVLCPTLWNMISKSVRKESKLRERAHGDGIQIGYDSPEAFEEIIWQAFWRDKFKPDRIIPWSPQDRDYEFETFFRNHMRKIIALRPGGQRYMSKNNANIARLELLPKIFPDCRIIVPIRNPRDHTASLLRQHTRFTKSHKKDIFGRQYMAWLGHFEFGANLRPLNFGNWMDTDSTLDQYTEEYWLTYWISAYEYILGACGPNCVLVDYTQLCRQPEIGLMALAEALEIEPSPHLFNQASRFRTPTAYESRQKSLGELEARANALCDALLERSIQHKN